MPPSPFSSSLTSWQMLQTMLQPKCFLTIEQIEKWQFYVTIRYITFLFMIFFVAYFPKGNHKVIILIEICQDSYFLAADSRFCHYKRLFLSILLCKRFRFLFSFSKLSFRILRLNEKYLDAKLMKVRVNSDSWEFKWLSAPAMHSKLCLVKRLLLYLHLTSAISIYSATNH